MKLRLIAAAAAAASLSFASAASAASYDYDFIDAIDNGPLGESIYSEFNTDTAFTGPSFSLIGYRDANGNKMLDIDANATEQVYAYADYNKAGFGVCAAPNAGHNLAGTSPSPTVVNQTYAGDGRNRCIQSSDDSIQSEFDEILQIVANENAILYSVTVNANHDGKLQVGQKVNIADVEYTLGAGDIAADNSFTVILNLSMSAGDLVQILSVDRPHLYLQSVVVSTIPLPASSLLLLGGLGGLAAMKRRKKA